jgi:hypothetical protein
MPMYSLFFSIVLSNCQVLYLDLSIILTWYLYGIKDRIYFQFSTHRYSIFQATFVEEVPLLKIRWL